MHAHAQILSLHTNMCVDHSRGLWFSVPTVVCLLMFLLKLLSLGCFSSSCSSSDTHCIYIWNTFRVILELLFLSESLLKSLVKNIFCTALIGFTYRYIVSGFVFFSTVRDISQHNSSNGKSSPINRY